MVIIFPIEFLYKQYNIEKSVVTPYMAYEEKGYKLNAKECTIFFDTLWLISFSILFSLFFVVFTFLYFPFF